jgi:hypothetical protein
VMWQFRHSMGGRDVIGRAAGAVSTMGLINLLVSYAQCQSNH